MMALGRLSLVSTKGARTRGLFTVVLALTALGLLARQARPQEALVLEPFDLVGHVLDEDGRPLVGAFVSLTGSDWGSLTDEGGRFRLPDLYEGTVELRAEQLGYETLEWRGDVRPGQRVELRMLAQPIVLEGLNVVTDRFQARRNAVATSVRAYDRAALATSPHFTALDFLQSRAGVVTATCRGRFSSRCVRVRGRLTEPVVWVDEAPVFGGMEYLEAVQPHDLYMVEVYASGRHIRAYTHQFMARAAKQRLWPVPFTY